jgi:hypothetical protein
MDNTCWLDLRKINSPPAYTFHGAIMRHVDALIDHAARAANPARDMMAGIATQALFSCGGCGSSGPELKPVSGKVTLDGAPVPEGTIVFLPTEQTSGPTTGASITQGLYEIPEEKGAIAGAYRVQITSVQKTGKKIPAGTPAPPGTMVDELRQVIPAKYNSSSELSAKVIVGDNSKVNFDLQSN